MGQAQARQPLPASRHYYELHIVDSRENCYIALGLARRVGIVNGCSQLFPYEEIRQLTPMSGFGSNLRICCNGFML